MQSRAGPAGAGWGVCEYAPLHLTVLAALLCAFLYAHLHFFTNREKMFSGLPRREIPTCFLAVRDLAVRGLEKGKEIAQPAWPTALSLSPLRWGTAGHV